MSLFEGYERRIDKINGVLQEYGIKSVEECKEITLAKGIDCDKIIRETQPICFENAVWAYTVGCAIAIKKGMEPNEAYEKSKGTYGRFDEAVKYIDPRKE